MLTLPHRSSDRNPVSSLAEQMGRFHVASAAHAMVVASVILLPAAWGGGLVMGVAICSIAEGTDRWERVAGPFPHKRWKRPVDGVLFREARLV